MTYTRNTTKDKLRQGKLALGLSIRLIRTPDAAKIAKATDHDFLFIDMEHTGLSFESVVDMCVAALDTGVTPMVRVIGHDHWQASRVLDCGAMGVVIPHVDTPEQARSAVDACKYPPRGHRSMAGGFPHFDFAPVPPAEAAAIHNENVLLAVMIETPLAVENADAIAAVEGVDILHVGTNDLLAQMGLHGQFDHPEVAKAYKTINDACTHHGKVAGMGGVRDLALCQRYLEMGFRFMTTNADLAFLLAAASEHTKGLRAVSLK
ncbi:MAG: 2-keto-3-deoxy-L-rhamnonate aldolase RhmA [Gammaproteobacteria bacterium]|jgi:2-keto-3-deoxy-L-rhamnonate aldolase RhmA